MSVRDAFVDAYRPYVRARLEARGWDVSASLEAALAEGEEWLAAALDELLAVAATEQTRGPLELFQEAMRFPTEALTEAGVEPVRRDPAAVSALPGDVYDLAPASSRQLGEAAWMEHLAWGAAKAAEFLKQE